MSLATTATISGRFGAAADVAAMSPSLFTPAAQIDMTQQVLPQPDILNAFSFRGLTAEDSGPKDPINSLQQRMQAVTNNTSHTWKPSNVLRPDQVIKGSEGVAHSHGSPKEQMAVDMKGAQVAEIKSILQASAAGGGSLSSQGPSAAPSRTSGGGLAGNMLMDAVVTGAATMALGPVGGIVATGLMAAKAGMGKTGLEGQGTLVTFNQQPSYFGASSSSSRSSRNNKASLSEYGYGASSSAATPQGAPATQAIQNKMNAGPGFGRADLLADIKTPKATFEDMAIKIAADSPAGKAAEGMRLNGRATSQVLLAQREGVDANLENINAAMEIGMKPPEYAGLKIPTFKMA